jgi:hypothetical protein
LPISIETLNLLPGTIEIMLLIIFKYKSETSFILNELDLILFDKLLSGVSDVKLAENCKVVPLKTLEFKNKVILNPNVDRYGIDPILLQYNNEFVVDPKIAIVEQIVFEYFESKDKNEIKFGKLIFNESDCASEGPLFVINR